MNLHVITESELVDWLDFDKIKLALKDYLVENENIRNNHKKYVHIVNSELEYFYIKDNCDEGYFVPYYVFYPIDFEPIAINAID